MSMRSTPEERRRREQIVADEEQFEALLAAALRAAPPVRPRRRVRWRPVAAVAATLLVAAGAWLGLRMQVPTAPDSVLGAEVIAHIHHEPHALAVTADRAPEADIERVLRRAGARFAQPVERVSYARLCPFRGRLVAHFVVQGERGPVTVLLLPEEHLTRPTPVRNEEFSGTLVPLEGGGSIAIVGQPDEDLQEIRDRFAEAVRWQL